LSVGGRFFFGGAIVHQTIKINSETAMAASNRKIHIMSFVKTPQYKALVLLTLTVSIVVGCSTVPKPEPAATTVVQPVLLPAQFTDLPGWNEDPLTEAWPAFLQTCQALKSRDNWRVACEQAQKLKSPDSASLRAYFVQFFEVKRVQSPEGQTSGLVTGYYEPLLRGQRQRVGRFQTALHAVPDDLLPLQLEERFPELKHQRVRGRLSTSAQGRATVIPYYTRAELLNGTGQSALKGKEIVWVDDAVEAFFLQVQGSGRVQLPDGNMLRLAYADTNGHIYRSVGRVLVDRGVMTLEQASMQSIKAWAQANPDKVDELLNNNPSYVFFREEALPDPRMGPRGSLGVPLTSKRSIAVDPRFIPLGAPVFLSTTHPLSQQPLRQLVMAQDTGGAIRGAVRADFFWGFGAEAGEQAGKMKQSGEMWVLLPKA
jgi:membrane-bound lytic murein transglycosylase A